MEQIVSGVPEPDSGVADEFKSQTQYGSEGASQSVQGAPYENFNPNPERGVTGFGDVRDQLGTKLVRRKLKTADVWYVIRIMGRISKDARERVLASEGNAQQVDVMGLFLTEGVDKAQAEINAWFAELTGVPANQIDAEDIGFYMDVLEDLDTVGIEGFLGRLIPWYRKKFGDSGRNSSPSE